MLSRFRALLPNSSPPLWAKVAVEFIACSMFHFVGSMSPTPLANGLALMTSVYYAAKVSGAHLNPAVSAVFCLLGFTHPVEAILYMLAQVAGCVTGALYIGMVVPGARLGAPPPSSSALGCFIPNPSLNRAQIFGWEALGTVMFIVPVMSVVWYTQNKQGYGNTGPIMVGISLSASAMAVGGWTGASLNPARTLGSAIVYDCGRHAVTGMYIAGEVVGALLAPAFLIPWYGISTNAWFTGYVPQRAKRWLRAHLPTIELHTLDKAPDREEPAPGQV
jgi:glycerol uptake facilitator-like aquaporin